MEEIHQGCRGNTAVLEKVSSKKESYLLDGSVAVRTPERVVAKDTVVLKAKLRSVLLFSGVVKRMADQQPKLERDCHTQTDVLDPAVALEQVVEILKEPQPVKQQRRIARFTSKLFLACFSKCSKSENGRDQARGAGVPSQRGGANSGRPEQARPQQ